LECPIEVLWPSRALFWGEDRPETVSPLPAAGGRTVKASVRAGTGIKAALCHTASRRFGLPPSGNTNCAAPRRVAREKEAHRSAGARGLRSSSVATAATLRPSGCQPVYSYSGVPGHKTVRWWPSPAAPHPPLGRGSGCALNQARAGHHPPSHSARCAVDRPLLPMRESRNCRHRFARPIFGGVFGRGCYGQPAPPLDSEVISRTGCGSHRLPCRPSCSAVALGSPRRRSGRRSWTGMKNAGTRPAWFRKAPREDPAVLGRQPLRRRRAMKPTTPRPASISA
jgi:hypothetical protein